MMVPINPLFIAVLLSLLRPAQAPAEPGTPKVYNVNVYSVNMPLKQGSRANLAFQREQRLLGHQSTHVSAKRAVGAQHSMARHE
jgi:hypothetical protein